MFSGFGFQFFNLDGASTHHMINEIGYRHALAKKKKNGFPGTISLDLHSGYYGPDGKWSRKIGLVSDHMYNPLTDDGDAINNAIEAFKIAYIEMNSDNKLQRKLAHFTCARGLHFVVDGLTPAHHKGHRLKNIKGWSNWHDPHWDHSKPDMGNLLFGKHSRFEFACARYMFFNTKKIIKNYRTFRKNASLEPFQNPEDLKTFLMDKALRISQTQVYEKFLTGKKIKQQIIKETFPEIIHAVEIYIRSLYLLAATRKKHGKFYIRIPRPSDIKHAFLQALVPKKPKNTNSVGTQYNQSGTGENIEHNRDHAKQNS